MKRHSSGNKSMWQLALLISSTLLTGCEPADDSNNHPLSKVVKDDQPVFHIESDEPWKIELGRGSGMYGLDTIKLDQEGTLIIHRMKPEQGSKVNRHTWETATLKLPAKTVTKLLEAVEANRLMELDKQYHADVADGTQWVLWIQQGKQEKAVYFNNHFPEQITKFAKRLDKIVWANSDLNLKWEAVPEKVGSKHQEELWESIKR